MDKYKIYLTNRRITNENCGKLKVVAESDNLDSLDYIFENYIVNNIDTYRRSFRLALVSSRSGKNVAIDMGKVSPQIFVSDPLQD